MQETLWYKSSNICKGWLHRNETCYDENGNLLLKWQNNGSRIIVVVPCFKGQFERVRCESLVGLTHFNAILRASGNQEFVYVFEVIQGERKAHYGQIGFNIKDHGLSWEDPNEFVLVEWQRW